jgi:tetratricopeptide (TPR) repeat protein
MGTTMNRRIFTLVAPPIIAALAGAALWFVLRTTAPEPEPQADATDLPIPPVPPRIAQGRDYEQCLSMLDDDPAAAAAFATGWQGTGGGDGAAHCLALSRIALGHPAEGAELLEKLAHDSQAAAAARAIVYGQSSQAWLMAEQGERAYGAATMALALLPDQEDMLIQRAIIAGNLNHYADAIADLDHALQLDPRRTDTLTLRAAAWRHVGRLEAAQNDIDAAVAIDADYPEALLERGILRQRQGNSEGAREDWQRTVELAPDTPTADLAEQNLALLDAGPARR